MNVLIDTCIIIDTLQSRGPYNKDAEAVFLSVANRRCVGFLTANSITDIYYLMHKALHSAEETKKVLGVLFNLFEILDTCGIDCRRALTSDTFDYEDAVMIEAAARAEIDCIVTRNLKDYAGAPMPVYSPSQFVGLLYADED
ncbi:MAG: PIN domain-containing protein [Oscillospiraceae bacterium]|nr:PIN domain-containing protein [Oscillospiraceae bacterium]